MPLQHTQVVNSDFRLSRTSFLVPTLQTDWMQQSNWGHDHG